MGMIIEASCPSCNYSKELFCGVGMEGCNDNAVKRIFSEDVALEFEKYKNENMIKTFIIENIITYCSHCNEISTTASLKYELTDGAKIVTINKCDKCQNELDVLNYDTLECPLCGTKLIKQESGLWD